ncbi:MAG: hypothetical protein JNJ83_21560 [Verrucomicrobiaceae bacterium]|nr:hypothetical protein [Verrucomicrobiaceae bacterium]
MSRIVLLAFCATVVPLLAQAPKVPKERHFSSIQEVLHLVPVDLPRNDPRANKLLREAVNKWIAFSMPVGRFERYNGIEHQLRARSSNHETMDWRLGKLRLDLSACILPESEVAADVKTVGKMLVVIGQITDVKLLDNGTRLWLEIKYCHAGFEAQRILARTKIAPR